MKTLIITIAAVALAAALTGCGPSKCEQAGGVEVVDYYMPVTTMMPVGKSFMPVTNMVTVFKCEMPEEAR